MKIPTQKGRALKQINRVVVQTKIVNILYNDLNILKVRWVVKNFKHDFDGVKVLLVFVIINKVLSCVEIVQKGFKSYI